MTINLLSKHSFSSPRETLFLQNLYLLYSKRMWYISVTILNNKELAEDCVMQTVENIINNVNLLRALPIRKVSKFIFISTRNTALHILESQKEALPLNAIEPCVEGAPMDIENKILTNMEVENLKQFISKLDVEYGDAFYLKNCFDMDVKDIADILSIPEKLTHQRICRATQILKAMARGDLYK